MKTQALSITENSYLTTLDFKLWLLFLEAFFHIKFSCLVVSDSLWRHGLQHTRFPCPSPTPGPCSKLMSIESLMPSNHLILCHPLLLPPSIFPSIRVFSNESFLQNRWPKCWNFSFSFSPSNEYPGLISFRWTGWISLQSKGFSRVFSNTTVQKHQFFGAQLSLEFNSHIHIWLLGKPQLWLDGTLLAN